MDFPILPINQIAQIEGNAGKPIYQMSKWWARRRSSVFRSMLIAAATKAPEDPAEAAKIIWDAYYGNHQKNEAFRQLKVADIFMGGGTTLVEGARLGMQMVGNDLNPVAWLVVKNELADVDLDEVNKLFDHIEREVKPQIMPFYACEGPDGEKGVWTHIPSGKKMGDDFDPLILKPEERKDYGYQGPEVIYTFWAKHGPCAAPGCGHRTPLMTNPVVAIKTLSVKTWEDIPCSHCHEAFDIERQEARMAPDVPLMVADTEKPYAIMDDAGYFTCPHCGHQHRDVIAATKGESSRLMKKSRTNKPVELTLLLHPDWLKGSPGEDDIGPLGGTATSSVEATQRWNSLRASNLELVEFRGKLPETITLSEPDIIVITEEGNVAGAKYTCMAPTCGKEQQIVKAIEASKATAPLFPFVRQCYSEKLKITGNPYGGRYFKKITEHDVKLLNAVEKEWAHRSKSDLKNFWPREEIPFGHMTHQRQPLPKHGYSHYWKMFNSLQLMTHATFLKALKDAPFFSQTSKLFVLGAVQQFLAYQNMFCYWHKNRDHFAPHLSDRTFSPKNILIEVGTFSEAGYGPWRSAREPLIDAQEWKDRPWELVSSDSIREEHPGLGNSLTSKSVKVYPNDYVLNSDKVYCGTSTELHYLDDSSIDLVITDPPFAGLIHYSELADFFYVWLKLALAEVAPLYFSGAYSPKMLEAVSNKARHPDDPDAFYKPYRYP